MQFSGLIPFFHAFSRKKLFWAFAEQDETIASIIQSLLDDHEMAFTDYHSLCATDEELESRMEKKIAEAHGLSTEQANEIVPLHLTASLVELDPLLDGLASCLLAMFDHYPVFFANSIINSILDSIVGTCTEPSIKIQSQSTSTLFPLFLRQRNGAGLAYALMMFPNSLQPVSYAVCFQVLADMDFWIASVNDILSYHKESAAGETNNYISNRANVEGKAPLTVASDIRKEVQRSRHYIYMTLSATAGQEAVKIWRIWERGFM
ncbi:hypothetical protein C0993_007532 [Termitomyces sp. T159_Od127]|nr:hypothetical protein C0993_007532 [Termitomyces sp. T159_Od127]